MERERPPDAIDAERAMLDADGDENRAGGGDRAPFFFDIDIGLSAQMARIVLVAAGSDQDLVKIVEVFGNPMDQRFRLHHPTSSNLHTGMPGRCSGDHWAGSGSPSESMSRFAQLKKAAP